MSLRKKMFRLLGETSYLRDYLREGSPYSKEWGPSGGDDRSVDAYRNVDKAYPPGLPDSGWVSYPTYAALAPSFKGLKDRGADAQDVAELQKLVQDLSDTRLKAEKLVKDAASMENAVGKKAIAVFKALATKKAKPLPFKVGDFVYKNEGETRRHATGGLVLTIEAGRIQVQADPGPGGTQWDDPDDYKKISIPPPLKVGNTVKSRRTGKTGLVTDVGGSDGMSKIEVRWAGPDKRVDNHYAFELVNAG